MTTSLRRFFQGAKPHRSGRTRGPLSLESLEDRIVMSWSATPPASIAVPSSYTSVGLNSLNDASGSASITSGEVDWYRFTAPSTGSYVLAATTPSSNVDTVIGLYSSSGSRLAFDDDSGDGTDSRATASLAANQVYYLGVTNHSASSARGGYNWSINGPNDDVFENNDSRSTATNLGTLPGRVYSLTGLQSRDEDWFRFTTTASGLATDYVRINFTHSRGDLDLGLYNSAGTLIRSSTGSSGQEQISLNGLAAGTYSVRVYGYSGARNPNYSLTVEPPDDAYENNDSRTAAANLGTLPGPAYSLAGLRLADEDWFRFTTTASGLATDYVRINFTHSQGDLDLGLYNSAGTLIRSSTGSSGQEQISLNGLAAGTYSVRVYGYSGSRNPSYSLTVEPPDDRYENNDSRTAAANLGTLPGPAYSLAGLRLADEDWFRFTTTASGLATDYVRINFTHSQGDLDLGLYNSAGTLIRSSTGSSGQEQISLNGLAAGTYSVRVYGYSGARNPSYSLTVEPPDDAYENNDSRATAAYLGSAATTITRTGLRLADDDWFRFTTTSATDYVRLNFLHSQGDIDMELYNSAGTRIATSTSSGNQELISLVGRAIGTYYVRIYGHAGARNPNYSLSVIA